MIKPIIPIIKPYLLLYVNMYLTYLPKWHITKKYSEMMKSELFKVNIKECLSTNETIEMLNSKQYNDKEEILKYKYNKTIAAFA